MTEVLSITSQPDGTSFFRSSSSLHRSPSQNLFLVQNPMSCSRSSPNLKHDFLNAGFENRLPTSLPSSAASSPRLTQPEYSNQPSCSSTPSSSLSFEEECNEEEDDDIIFPSYDNDGSFAPMQELGHSLEPHPSPELIRSDTITPSASEDSLPTPSYVENAEFQATAGDDTALRREPTRHVDYLSHNWREEDIWSSWRYVVAKRKAYSNSTRLENASWRTWTKSKYRLKTVSPDILNWYASH